MSDNETVTPADIAAELMLDAARDIDAQAISERLDETEMPDEPDGFAEQVADLVKTASISIDWPDTSDGTINVGDGLVGALVAKLGQERDAFALAAEQNASELEMVREVGRQEAAKLRAEIAGLTAANQRLLDRLHNTTGLVVAAQQWRQWTEDNGSDQLHERVAALIAAIDALDAGHAEQPTTTAEVAAQGCDDCSVEPGEQHRYAGCPGNQRAIARKEVPA